MPFRLVVPFRNLPSEICFRRLPLDVFATILALSDAAVPGIAAARQRDPDHRDYRGQMIPGKGFAEPGASAVAADVLVSVYLCPASVYFRDGAVLAQAADAMEFLLSRCHEDGSIDLMETNFHDCTCNAFAVHSLAYTFRLLEREAKTPDELRVKALVFDFLRKSAEAMLAGGFHTANHRWVLASALALCADILGDERCAGLARIYLSEDIDINAEGDYTERSAGVYDAVCNRSLIILAQEFGMPELFDLVSRNIHKTICCLEADFTVLTLSSKRQDRGKEFVPLRQFLPALQLYRHNADESALLLARGLLERMDAMRLRQGSPAQVLPSVEHQNLLTRLLLEPALAQPLPDTGPLPDCEVLYPLAGLARYRRGAFSLTLLRDNPTLLKVQNGYLKMQLRLAGSFFGRGQMLAQSIEPVSGGYRCVFTAERGYMRPMAGLHESNWENIDITSRETVGVCRFAWRVDVFPRPDGADLHILAEGTPDVPLKAEFLFEPGGMLRTGGASIPGNADTCLIAGSAFTYERYGETLLVEGGCACHEYTSAMRGSEPPAPGTFGVYHTMFSPYQGILQLTVKP